MIKLILVRHAITTCNEITGDILGCTIELGELIFILYVYIIMVI